MIQTKVLARRLAFRLAAGLSTVALAAGVTALGASAAQAAPTSIAVNTANWSGSAGFGSTAPSWFEDGFGLVHLQGAAKQVSATGTAANLLGTLPPPARPARNVFVIVHTFAGTYADLEVASNGQINLIPPRLPAVKDFRFVSLEGITYRPTGSAIAIAVNGPSWSGSAGFGSTPPSWFKDGSGVVHLQGAARQVSAGPNLLGTLPPVARPARNVFVIVHTFAGTYADLEVASNGQINLIDPYGFAVKDYSFVSLEGISYSPGAIFNHMAPPFPGLNTANWSANAGFGSSEPGWNEDTAGVVHLQGAATQISLAGDTNLVATLPAVVRPDRTIYTIVHTFNGTYADLSIDPSGQIRLIDPRPPMGKDYAFVSLEGVTYHP
jgi:hypothetical protein